MIHVIVLSSPLILNTLFSSALEQVFQELDWQEKGIRVNGTYLSNLRFADDIAIIAQDANTLQDMMQELAQPSEAFKLKINTINTKVMFNEYFKQQVISQQQ